MKLFATILFTTFLFSCSSAGSDEEKSQVRELSIIGADLSLVPELLNRGLHYKTTSGSIKNPVGILRENGVNTVRLRLWHQPKTNTSSFNEVKTFSRQLQQEGLKVLLTIHYSDTWADPGKQSIPKKWQEIPFNALKDSVSAYTQKIIKEIGPEYVQIGNEINNGLLWPYGDRWKENGQFTELLKTGIEAVKDANAETKTILHYAGIEGAVDFFKQTDHLGYDLIGLSYYPMWHGKDLDKLSDLFTALESDFKRDFILVETSYPFTLDYQDSTNNIVGRNDQILSDFPATPGGQAAFLKKLTTLVSNSQNGIGICYWGGEWITTENIAERSGSPYENQALFDFDHVALPIVKAFKPIE